MATSEQQWRLVELFPFDFTIIYEACKENQGANVLLRRSQHAEFLALVLFVNIDFLNIQGYFLQDRYTIEIITSLKQDPTNYLEFGRQ